ncbi:MAG TPA: VTT domain-containing protein [Candidatus Methylacidiphilales bacterium]
MDSSSSHHGWLHFGDWGYLGIFAVVFLEQLGLPIPALPILVAAGAMVSAGTMSLAGALSLSVAAALLADFLWYGIGHVRGGTVLNLMCRLSWRPDTCISKTKNVFGKYGAKTLLVAKFIPGLSTLAPPLAGMSRIPWRTFLLWDGAGSLLWALIPLVAGSYIEKAVDALAPHVADLRVLVAHWPWALGLAVAAILLWRFGDRRSYRNGLASVRARSGIAAAALRELLNKENGPGVVVLDVRDPLSLAERPRLLPTAKWFPFATLETRLGELDLAKPIVVYCACPKDEGAIGVAELLTKKGAADARPLLGGIEAWEALGEPTVPWEG